MDVGMEEVSIAGMQQWPDVSQTSYTHTVAPKYSLNRRCLLLLALLTVSVNMRAWILSSTSTAQSHTWMSPLLLLSLATRLWSQQPAPDQDTWPKELKRGKVDRHPHINLAPLMLETPGRPGPQARKFISTLMRDASHQGHLVSYPKCAPQCHLKTTTHSRRYVTSDDHCHSQFLFC